jgi:hypothetical protein
VGLTSSALSARTRPRGGFWIPLLRLTQWRPPNSHPFFFLCKFFGVSDHTTHALGVVDSASHGPNITYYATHNPGLAYHIWCSPNVPCYTSHMFAPSIALRVPPHSLTCFATPVHVYLHRAQEGALTCYPIKVVGVPPSSTSSRSSSCPSDGDSTDCWGSSRC